MKNEIQLLHGDCLERLKELPDNSVDSVVTDPPYGLSFMGKKWDYDVPSVEVWAECLRVLKPGGHLLAFAGTRTQHRMAVRIEDAGFEIRDMIAWVYGSGFPKSLDVSKALDKAAGAEREVVGYSQGRSSSIHSGGQSVGMPDPITAPATHAARQWQGWGTALKPALEPITVARKPLVSTVAANVMEHGTGAINVDGCRVGNNAGWSYPNGRGGSGWHGRDSLANNLTEPMTATQGRWPANLIHDGSEEVVEGFPETGGSTARIGKRSGKSAGCLGEFAGQDSVAMGHNDNGGSAARFFYCAKASKRDRDEGCEHLPEHQEGLQLPRGKCSSCGKWKNAGEEKCKCGGIWEMTFNPPPKARNNHPTVKPTDLMRYLCRLVTPPGGTVLDPFMGSGSTGKAAMLEGFQFIGIEREADYMEIAKARINAAKTLI